MIKTISDFFLKYPQFYATNNGENDFEGNLIFKDSHCTVQLELPNFPELKNFKCILKNSLITVNLENNKSINENWNIEEFIDNLPEIWNNQNQKSDFIKELNIAKKTLNILNQVLTCKDELNDIKMYANDELTSIKFDSFEGYDGHYLELKIENFTVKINDHSLPSVSENWNIGVNEDLCNIESLFSSPSTVMGYLKQFIKLLENFELFYKNINALDHLCWIVEPANITFKCNWRMFKLIDNVYIKVIINPLCPSSINVNIYGPTFEVAKYREIYRENVSKWDPELDVYNNLLKIFDLMLFPCPDTTIIDMETDDDLSCKICLCYQDEDGHIPICSCDNPKCNMIYHVMCLKRWFANSVDGRTFLSVAIGICPFCKEKISASFRSLLEE